MADRSGPGTKVPISSVVSLVLQALLFSFVVLVRGGAGYLLGPILMVALYQIWVNWRTPAKLRQMVGKIGFTGVIGMALVLVVAASIPPEYLKTGRFFSAMWHRAIVGLSYHPNWPFGNLRETYDCTRLIPKGLDVGPGKDQNGHCIFWSSYPPALSSGFSKEIDAHLYDEIYEKVLRSAFFNIVLSYPRQIFELYLYYKSKMIINTLRASIKLDLAAQSPTILTLASLQCAVFVVFVASGAYRGRREITPPRIIFVLFGLSLLPLYYAWSFLHTSADTIAMMYASVAIVLGMFVLGIIQRIFKMLRTQSNCYRP
jgi:hypothetical protein